MILVTCGEGSLTYTQEQVTSQPQPQPSELYYLWHCPIACLPVNELKQHLLDVWCAILPGSVETYLRCGVSFLVDFIVFPAVKDCENLLI